MGLIHSKTAKVIESAVPVPSSDLKIQDMSAWTSLFALALAACYVLATRAGTVRQAALSKRHNSESNLYSAQPTAPSSVSGLQPDELLEIIKSERGDSSAMDPMNMAASK